MAGNYKLHNIVGCGFFCVLHSGIENISTFDPSNYTTSCSKQVFLLEPGNNQWILESVIQYRVDGEILNEVNYLFDDSGQAYYVTPGGIRNNTPNVSWEQLGNFANYHSGYNIIYEEFDEFGRLIYRESKNKNDPLETNTLQWYYDVDSGNKSGVKSLCTLVETSQIVSANDEVYRFFDADWNTISEFTSYTIFNFDRYGNITNLNIQTDVYFRTDRKGYLQMIIMEWYDDYEVIRVDSSGKPLWSAQYSREDRELLNYTIWNYSYN